MPQAVFINLGLGNVPLDSTCVGQDARAKSQQNSGEYFQRPLISFCAASAKKPDRDSPRNRAAASIASTIPLSKLRLTRTERFFAVTSGTAMRYEPDARSSATKGLLATSCTCRASG